MLLPPTDRFLAQLRAHAAPSPEAAAWVDQLLARLRAPYQALAAHAPASIQPASSPWPGQALAFEAGWPDGRLLTVATRCLSAGNLDSQVTLTQHGVTKTSVLTAHQRLAAALDTCLGPAPDV